MPSDLFGAGDEKEPELLASAYRRSLEVAVANKLRSISIPSIQEVRLATPKACGANGYENNRRLPEERPTRPGGSEDGSLPTGGRQGVSALRNST